MKALINKKKKIEEETLEDCCHDEYERLGEISPLESLPGKAMLPCRKKLMMLKVPF